MDRDELVACPSGDAGPMLPPLTCRCEQCARSALERRNRHSCLEYEIVRFNSQTE